MSNFISWAIPNAWLFCPFAVIYLQWVWSKSFIPSFFTNSKLIILGTAPPSNKALTWNLLLRVTIVLGQHPFWSSVLVEIKTFSTCISEDFVTLLLVSLGFLGLIKTLLNSALNPGASSQICSRVKEILASSIDSFAALCGAVDSLETGFGLTLGLPVFFSWGFKDCSGALLDSLGILTNLTSSSSSMSSILTLFLLWESIVSSWAKRSSKQ